MLQLVSGKDIDRQERKLAAMADNVVEPRFYGGWRYFEFKNSVLTSPEAEKLDGHWWEVLYLFLWVPFTLVAIHTCVRVWIWRLRNWSLKKTDRRRWALAPEEIIPFGYGRHPVGIQIRQCVQGVGALDPIYHFPAWLPKPNTLDELKLTLVYQQPEARGVRNRLKVVYMAHLSHWRRLYRFGKRKIVVYSLACGSAEAVLRAAETFLHEVNDPSMVFEFRFADTSEIVLEVARDLASHCGINPNWVTTHPQELRQFIYDRIAAGEKADDVDFVGFPDYLKMAKEIRYFKLVRQILAPGGCMITAHINWSIWSFVVRWGTNWLGLRRRPSFWLMFMLLFAGFSWRNIRSISEPCGAHTVAIGFVD